MVKFLYYGLSKELLGYCTKTSHKKNLKHLSNEMKTIACNRKLVSLSAIQVGVSYQYFIILNKQHLKQNQWQSYTRLKPAYYNGFLNVELKDSSVEKSNQWEQCGSYPGLKMLIERPKSIKIDYSDEQLKDYSNEHKSGFQARVIQHELDHYFGLDFMKKALQVQINDQKLKEKYQDECNLLLKQFRGSLKEGQIDYKVIDNTYFYKLKQFITYSIVDKLKQV